jgi:hypothetical protein
MEKPGNHAHIGEIPVQIVSEQCSAARRDKRYTKKKKKKF